MTKTANKTEVLTDQAPLEIETVMTDVRNAHNPISIQGAKNIILADILKKYEENILEIKTIMSDLGEMGYFAVKNPVLPHQTELQQANSLMRLAEKYSPKTYKDDDAVEMSAIALKHAKEAFVLATKFGLEIKEEEAQKEMQRAHNIQLAIERRKADEQAKC